MNPFDRLSNRWFAGTAVVIVSLMGVVLIVGAFADSDEESPWITLAAPVGLMFLTISFFTFRRFLGHPEPLRAHAVNAGVEIPIWRRQLVDMSVFLLCVVVTAVWGLTIAVSMDAIWWPWALFLVLSGTVAAQMVRSIRRRPALTLRPEGVTYRGPSVDSSLAWDDIVRIIVLKGPRSDVLVINGRPDSPSWRTKRRYWLTPVEEKAPKFGMGVEILGPRDDRIRTVVVPILLAYIQNRQLRHQLGTSAAIELLDTQSRRADVQHYGSL